MKEPYNEHWKPVYGYDGLYQVSTFGRVRRINKQRVTYLKPIISGLENIKKVRLFSENGKSTNKPLVEVVAEAFKAIPFGTKLRDNVIVFLDKDKDNIVPDNLMYKDKDYPNRFPNAVYHKYQKERNNIFKNSGRQVFIKHKKTEECLLFENIKETAKFLGCSSTFVSQVLKYNRINNPKKRYCKGYFVSSYSKKV